MTMRDRVMIALFTTLIAASGAIVATDKPITTIQWCVFALIALATIACFVYCLIADGKKSSTEALAMESEKKRIESDRLARDEQTRLLSTIANAANAHAGEIRKTEVAGMERKVTDTLSETSEPETLAIMDQHKGS